MDVEEEQQIQDAGGDEEQADFGDMGPEGDEDKFGMEGMDGEGQGDMDWGEEDPEAQQQQQE